MKKFSFFLWSGQCLRNLRRGTVILLLTVAFLSVGSAVNANLIINGSFEGSFEDTAIKGTLYVGFPAAIDPWEVITYPIDRYESSDYPLNAQDGNWYLDLTDYENYAGPGGVAQTISTTPGNVYHVEFWLGSSTLYNAAGAPTITVGGGGSDFADMLFTGTVSGENTWDQFGFDFTASASSYTLTFQGGAPGFPNNYYIGLDNVSVNQVPEASTMLLLGFALIGLAGFTRRKFKK